MTNTDPAISAAAAVLGRKGGQSRSEAKRAAVAQNGRLYGGRKPKRPVADYIPARLRPHLKDAYRDSDGIWANFDERVFNPANESSTIHADTIRELVEEAARCEIR